MLSPCSHNVGRVVEDGGEAWVVGGLPLPEPRGLRDGAVLREGDGQGRRCWLCGAPLQLSGGSLAQ